METSITTQLFPAFKEWAAIVEALGAGEQILLLRKGGIAEGRGGFQVKNQRFWLYPTFFHAQLEESKSGAEKFFALAARTGTPAKSVHPLPDTTDFPAPQASTVAGRQVAPDATSPVTLRYFAKVEQSSFIDEWSRIQALDAQHLWKESLVRERFDWSKPPGLHVIIVRVFTISQPRVITPTAEMLGCKSWIDVPFDFEAVPSTPVLSDEAFEKKRKPYGSVK